MQLLREFEFFVLFCLAVAAIAVALVLVNQAYNLF